MKIAIIEYNGDISVETGLFNGCEDAKCIEKLFADEGRSDEKVIDIIDLPDDNPLCALFFSLFQFWIYNENSFQDMFEEFLTKIFQSGKIIGENKKYRQNELV